MARALLAFGVCGALAACGGAEPAPVAAPASAAGPTAPPPSREPSVSTIVRTRLPGDTSCGADDVCGFFLQVISPGAEPEQIAARARKIVSGHCAGTIIVYRDKRGVLGSGPVFSSEAEKQTCKEALGRTGDIDDYPRSAVWRKAE